MEMTLTPKARSKVGLPPMPAVAWRFDPITGPHFHLWLEKGWSGSLSPKVTLREAAEIVRNYLREPSVESSVADATSFPFTLVLFTVGGEGYRFVLKECNGERLYMNDGWNGQPCNDTEEWR